MKLIFRSVRYMSTGIELGKRGRVIFGARRIRLGRYSGGGFWGDGVGIGEMGWGGFWGRCGGLTIKEGVR